MATVDRYWTRYSSGELTGHRYAALLGLRTFDTAGLLERVRQGLAYKAWERFEEASGLPRERLLEWVRIPARTLARRAKEGRLRSDESDRLLRASRVFSRAFELHEGDADATRRWLVAPSGALGDEAPIRYAETDVGAREVEQLIGRLEHGVPS